MVRSPLFLTLLKQHPELDAMLVRLEYDHQAVVEKMQSAVPQPVASQVVETPTVLSTASRQNVSSDFVPLSSTNNLPLVLNAYGTGGSANSDPAGGASEPSSSSSSRQAAEILAAQMLFGLAELPAAHTPPLDERISFYQEASNEYCLQGDAHNNQHEENDQTAGDEGQQANLNKAPNRNSKKYKHLSLANKYEIVQKLRYYETEARTAKNMCNMHQAIATEYDVCESTIYQIVKKQLEIENKYLAQQIEKERGGDKKRRSRDNSSNSKRDGEGASSSSSSSSATTEILVSAAPVP
eukprot:gene44740-55671_t